MGNPPVFQSVKGTWTFSHDNAEQTDSNGVSQCCADIGFTDFTVEFGMRVQFEKGQAAEAKFLMAGADRDDERHRIDFMYERQLCRIVLGGSYQPTMLSLEADYEYPIRIRVNNNFISVFVEDAKIIDNFQFGRTSDGKIGFGTYCASARFSSIKVTQLTSRNCFVVMPFDDKCNLLYEQAILPAFDEHPRIKFKTTRADKNMTTGKISAEILTGIKDADLVIADITSHNMNVFYEVGVAHAFFNREDKKGVILVVQEPDTGPLNIPFDLADWRCHTYQFSTNGLNELRKKLVGVAESVLTDKE